MYPQQSIFWKFMKVLKQKIQRYLWKTMMALHIITANIGHTEML